VIGSVPLHCPRSADSTCPWVAVPAIVTGAVFTGGEAAGAAAGNTDPPAIVASATAATHQRSRLVFRVRLIRDGYLIRH
jgi:hypothetical protein